MSTVKKALAGVLICCSLCLGALAAQAQNTTMPVLYLTGYLDFGDRLSEQDFLISNSSGAGFLEWSLGEVEYWSGDGWISSITPLSGTTNTMSSVSVTVSRDGLAPGTYEALLPVISNGGVDNMLMRITVAETPPEPVPELLVATESLEMGATRISRAFAVSNAGDAALNWKIDIDYENADGWITLSTASGSVPAGGDQAVSVFVNREGLEFGVYAADLVITSGDQTAEVAVTMEVAVEIGEAVVAVDRTVMLFLNASEEEQELTIGNALGEGMNWAVESITYQKGEGWLSVTPEEGYFGSGERATCTVAVDRSGLKRGLYGATMQIVGNGSHRKDVRVILRATR